ncbi:MAG: GntR family transcriptional regulator [Aminivibrio sp.]|nr:GntR family transcriptional regulator [Aminivibrio sp.]
MRKKKKDQAYEEIRKLILQRRSTDRFSLSENSLAAEMRMSRTPIREALQRLQTEGFIEIHPNRGVVIPEVSVVEVNETFALRMAVEEFVIREMAPQMSPDNIGEMDLYLARQREAMERNDVLEYLRHDKDFHDLFFRLYANSLIFNTIQRVLDRFYSMGTNVLRRPGSVQRSFAEHCAIADAVRAGDGEKASAAMHAHLITGKNNVLSIPGNIESVV